MAARSEKIISINGVSIGYVPNSLKTKGGYGETTNRVQQFGSSTKLIPYTNSETKIGSVSFDLLVQDMNDGSDPRLLIKTWKANAGANQIVISPVGAGQTELFNNASLMNDPEINDSNDGSISLEFQSSPVIFTN